ncbi:hypothetical protein [Intrasporangium sp. DVR]|uniref:hypothetical protein n=1 Tax=Intrasporangium sp. DVR TaxID=3127867 RepID=UPI00313A5A0E
MTRNKANGVPWVLLFLAAAAIALIYIVFAAIAFTRAGDSTLAESTWLRTVFVIQGFEAMAFTAIGWLFGREVHRGTAEAATEQAQEARQEAAVATDRAVGAERDGWRLAEAVRARAELAEPGLGAGGGPGGGPGGDERAPEGGGLVASEGSLFTLKALADNLFPAR